MYSDLNINHPVDTEFQRDIVKNIRLSSGIESRPYMLTFLGY